MEIDCQDEERCDEKKYKKLGKTTVFMHHNLDNLIFTKRDRKQIQRLETPTEKCEKVCKYKKKSFSPQPK